MRLAAPILLLLPLSALAGDFRTLDFGASCTDVVAQEIALGSKAIKPRVEGMGILFFEGEGFGRQLDFSYFCPKGALFAGDYLLRPEPLSDAIASYESVHKALSGVYGAPILDNSPWAQPTVHARWLEKDPLKYMTTWQTPRLSVTTFFSPSLPEQPTGWRVSIHFVPAFGATRSNPSLERTRER
jgi:hypothetical protein